MAFFLPSPNISEHQDRGRLWKWKLTKQCPGFFFYGATQNNTCGGRALLFLIETHFYELVASLGEGSNNFAELMSLKLLLVFAAKKGCRNLNFMGDSMNVINWINGTQQCRNLKIVSILLSTKEVQNSFISFSCRHVYRENNQEADNASKEGLSMAMGQWKIREQREGTIKEFYHVPLIE